MPKNLNATKNSQVEPIFQQMVEDLKAHAEQINSSSADLVILTVSFAQKLRHQFAESLRLDRMQPTVTSAHKQYLMSQLRQVSEISEAQIESRYNTIADQADALKHFAKYIPPYREAIYEIACAAKQKEPIKGWIDAGHLTSESTISDIKKLRGKKVSERKKLPKDYSYAVTFFFKSAEKAGKILSPIILSQDDFKIQSEKALANALKTKQDIHAAYLKKSAA